MGWSEDRVKLAKTGFSNEQIQSAASVIADNMNKQGMGVEDFDEYFGKPPVPDHVPVTEALSQAFKRNLPDPNAKNAPDPDSVGNAIKGMWQNSIIGLGVRHELPSDGIEKPSVFDEGSTKNTVLRNVQGLGTALADAPVYAASALAGFVTAGPPGVLPATMGIPAGIRSAFTDSIKKGGIHSAKDFAEMADNAFVETIKGGLVGQYSAMAGEGLAAGLGIKPAVNAVTGAQTATAAGTLANLTGQAVSMPVISDAMEGRLPEPQEFLDSAVQMAGFHALGHYVGKAFTDSSANSPTATQEKLLKIYSETGMHPNDAAGKSMNEPYFRQQMLSQNQEVPSSLDPMRQPTVKSDFVIVDGKLIPGDQEKAQAEFPFVNKTMSEMIEDHKARNNPEKQLEAAKLHDPEAFKQLEDQSKLVKGGLDNIRLNNERITAFSSHEANVKELEDLRQKLANPEVNFKDKAAHETALAREQELLKTEAKDSARADIAQSLRDKNVEIMNEIRKTRDNEPLKQRLTDAWERGRETIRNNLNDRIRNTTIELRDHADATPFSYLNSDFMEPGEHTPTMEEHAKIELMDNHNLNLFYDEGHVLSKDEQMAMIMKDHLELAEHMTPELVHELPAETNELGEVTKEPEKFVYAGRRKPGFIERTKEAIKNLTMEKMVEHSYNDLIRLKNKTQGLNIPLSKNPFQTMLHSRGSEKRGLLAIGLENEKEGSQYGVISPLTGEKIHDSLLQSLKKNGVDKTNIDRFKQYVIFKHGIDENARNLAEDFDSGAKGKSRETGVDDVEAKAYVAAHEKEFDAAQKAFTSWHNAVLQSAVDGGLITQVAKDALVERYPNYSPFNRLNEDGTGKGKGGKNPNIFYERKGSDLQFLDPMTSSMEKAFNVAKSIEENKAKLETFGPGGLNDMWDGDLLKDISSGAPPSLDEEVNATESDPSYSRTADTREQLRDDQVGYFDKGQYKIATFHDEALAKTLKAMKFDPGVTGILGKMYGMLVDYTGLRRNAAIANPAFLERHVIRANLFSFLLGADVRSLAKAPLYLKEAYLKKSDLYVEALKNKVFDGSSADIGDTLSNRNLVARDDSHGALGTIRNAVKSIFGLVHHGIRITQDATALSIFSDKLDKIGENPTMADKMNAGLESNKLFLNGLQRGTSAQVFNLVTAFQHYAIQGFGKGIEAAKENPGRLATAGSFLMGGSLLAYQTVKDDDRYKSMPDYLKNSAIWVKVPGISNLVPIPVPWELGTVFCTIPRMIAQTIHEGEAPGRSAMTEALATLVPLKPPTPWEDYQAIHSNYNSMTDKNTVPENTINLAPEAQVRPWTSNTALAISKAFNSFPGGNLGMHLKSPVMVDHIIQNILGQGGVDTLKILETSLQSSGVKLPIEKSWAQLAIDQPFIRGVIGSQPTYNAQPLEDFKNVFGEMQNLKDSYDIINKADPDKGAEFLDKHPELNDYDAYKSAHQAVKTANITIQGVNLDRNQSPSDKKQLTEQAYRDAIDITRQKLDELKQLKNNN